MALNTHSLFYSAIGNGLYSSSYENVYEKLCNPLDDKIQSFREREQRKRKKDSPSPSKQAIRENATEAERTTTNKSNEPMRQERIAQNQTPYNLFPVNETANYGENDDLEKDDDGQSVASDKSTLSSDYRALEEDLDIGGGRKNQRRQVYTSQTSLLHGRNEDDKLISCDDDDVSVTSDSNSNNNLLDYDIPLDKVYTKEEICNLFDESIAITTNEQKTAYVKIPTRRELIAKYKPGPNPSKPPKPPRPPQFNRARRQGLQEAPPFVQPTPFPSVSMSQKPIFEDDYQVYNADDDYVSDMQQHHFYEDQQKQQPYEYYSADENNQYMEPETTESQTATAVWENHPPPLQKPIVPLPQSRYSSSHSENHRAEPNDDEDTTQVFSRRGRELITQEELRRRRILHGKVMQKRQQLQDIQAENELNEYRQRGYRKSQEDKRKDMSRRLELQKMIREHYTKKGDTVSLRYLKHLLENDGADLEELEKMAAEITDDERNEQWANIFHTGGLVGVRVFEWLAGKLLRIENIDGFTKYVQRQRSTYAPDFKKMVQEHLPVSISAPQKPESRIASNLLRDFMTYLTFNFRRRTHKKDKFKSLILDLIAFTVNSDSLLNIVPSLQDFLEMHTEKYAQMRGAKSENMKQHIRRWEEFQQMFKKDSKKYKFPSAKRVLSKLDSEDDEENNAKKETDTEKQGRGRRISESEKEKVEDAEGESDDDEEEDEGDDELATKLRELKKIVTGNDGGTAAYWQYEIETKRRQEEARIKKEQEDLDRRIAEEEAKNQATKQAISNQTSAFSRFKTMPDTSAAVGNTTIIPISNTKTGKPVNPPSTAFSKPQQTSGFLPISSPKKSPMITPTTTNMSVLASVPSAVNTSASATTNTTQNSTSTVNNSVSATTNPAVMNATASTTKWKTSLPLASSKTESGLPAVATTPGTATPGSGKYRAVRPSSLFQQT